MFKDAKDLKAAGVALGAWMDNQGFDHSEAVVVMGFLLGQLFLDMNTDDRRKGVEDFFNRLGKHLLVGEK